MKLKANHMAGIGCLIALAFVIWATGACNQRYLTATTSPAPQSSSQPENTGSDPNRAAPHQANTGRPDTIDLGIPAFFSNGDLRLLELYGGSFVLTGEGPFVRQVPVDTISFDSSDRVHNDSDFAVVFPSIRRMDPHILNLEGQHVSDESIALLNKLRSLWALDLRGTEVTPKGLSNLRVKSLMTLNISKDVMNDAEVAELQKHLPRLKISRWPTTSPSTSLDGYASKYAAAKAAVPKLLVMIDAVESGVVARGKPIDVLKQICGEDVEDKGELGAGKQRRSIVRFEPQPTPPATSPVPGVPAAIGYTGWYMVVDYWTDFGTIERYYFSNLHK